MRAYLIVAVVLAALAVSACGEDEPATFVFESGPCPVDPLPAEPDAIECGDVVIGSGSDEVRLAVMRLRALDGLAEEPPLLWVDGGPGAPTLDLRAVEVAQLWRPLLGVRRDIILFDQRGTGRSQPSLACPGIGNNASSLQQDLAGADDTRARVRQIERCVDALAAAGVDTTRFGLSQAADDVDAVRQALGYDEVALMATSFGTLTAQLVMTQHPDTVHAAVLDAPVPIGTNPWADAPATFVSRLQALFAACDDNPTCRMRWPDAGTTFDDLVARLAREPLEFDVEYADRTETVVLNDRRLVLLLRDLMFRPSDVGMIPRLIHETAGGDTALVSRLLARAAPQPVSIGAQLSYICSLQQPAAFTSQVDSVDEALRPALEQVGAFYRDACEAWPAEVVDPRQTRRTTLDVPVLLLGGQYDPIAAPGYVDALADQLPNTRDYVVPWSGHGSVDYLCPLRMASSFMATPGESPPSTCLGDITFRFDPGRETYVSDAGYVVQVPAGWPEREGDGFVRWTDPETRGSIVVGGFDNIGLQDAIDQMWALAFDRFVGQPISTEDVVVGSRTWLRETRGDTEADHLVLSAVRLDERVWVVGLRGPLADINSIREYYEEAIARFGVVVASDVPSDDVSDP